jgi:hypothetical protein
MSTDPIGAALTRDDSAVTADAPQTASEQSSELSSIATAIERVEALLADGGPEPEGSEAIERIADIAFVLHERDVEASLCDALDAAVRELASANTAKRSNVHHVRQAAEMLRELTQRVADMVALLQVSPLSAANHVAGNETASGETAPEEGEPATVDQSTGEHALDGEIPREGLFPAELLEDDEFARAVAELAASLPALVEPVEAVVVTLRESVDLAAEGPPSAMGPDEAIEVALCEPADFAAEERVSAPEPDEAVVVARDEPAESVADEPPFVPEPDGAGSGMQNAADALAADEPESAFGLEEVVAETQPAAAPLASQESARAPEPEEPASETQYELAKPPADEPALEQQRFALADAPAIEPAPVEESPIAELASEPLASDVTAAAPDVAAEVSMHDAIPDAPASEGAAGETLSEEETLLGSADALAQPPSDLPGASTDHSLVNGHAIVSMGSDAPQIVSDALSSPAPQAVPESETGLAPDSPPIAAPGAEPELPKSGEASAPADVETSAASAEPPSDQSSLGHNANEEPAQIAGDEADEFLAESTAGVEEETRPRFESSQTLLPELALVDPQDDPGDLFEPLADTAPSIAAENLAEVQSANKISAHPAENQARLAAAAADPLAAMRTLSAEELLALFT